jgi:fructose-1,6-bisphosphatase/inositol monophosphatase family enzyme
MSHPIPASYLLPHVRRYCRSLLGSLREASDSGSLQKFLEIDQPAHKDPDNVTRKIDNIAQNLAVQFFDPVLGDAIERYGEEGKPLPPNIGKTKRTVLLIDPIDGTDLLARGFSNWCSALVFFHPASEPGKKILLTAVAHGAGLIYYATSNGAFVELPPKVKSVDQGNKKRWLKRTHRPQRKLELSDDSPAFSDASVCFYGQKAGSLLSIVEQPGFIPKIRAIDRLKNAKAETGQEEQRNERQRAPSFRIYNLGGNPMLAKIAEGTVDVVFRFSECQPHDFIPGAFIAERAGAKLMHMDGSRLSLENYLLDPSSRGGYIVAASQVLADATRDFLTLPTSVSR